MAIFLSTDQACEFLHVKKSYLYQLVHKKKIPHYKPLGSKILFDQQELENFILKGRVDTRDELESKAVELLNNRGQ
ncbi:MAG TPA: helix-turn-helix domain-containing protein [Anaerolineaceae bacterium]|jgi:excisionase family DNA binding protein|nr:helix-turn-helix domain-containing protein [Anaerolineaceae bacterium]HQK34786.1 helix-turn-helix domain-containing protein [Spirochaetales bacterium]HRU78307.1 helix-turn-helix domain-containing protein [Rectinema sp.]